MMRRGPGYGGAPPMPASRGPPPPPIGTHVSNVTNSNDFASKNSRVFVGNLNTFALTKEDVDGIFSPYGLVTGISMHKGYAFVQYSHPGEARRAVAFENGNSYGGQILDLNIVSEPKKSAPKRNSGPGMNDRRPPPQSSPSMPQAAKRPRQESNASMQRSNLVTLSSSSKSPIAARPRSTPTPNTSATRAAAAAVKRAATTVTKSTVSGSQQSSSASSVGPAKDVLICGVCKMQFTSLHSLAQHKKIPCRLRTSCQCQTNPPPKPSEEPELDCATCDARFDSAWALCQHCQKEHNISIFKMADGDLTSNNASGTAKDGDSTSNNASGTAKDGTKDKAEEKNGQEESGGAKKIRTENTTAAKK